MLTTIQNVWENHDFKVPYLVISICNLFEIFRTIVDLISIDAIMLRLLGATNVLMHETIRIANICHCSQQVDYITQCS